MNLIWDKVDFENRVIRIDHTKNGEYRAIPMNQRLLKTLKMVDNHSNFVFHKDDGTRFGDVKEVDVDSGAVGFTQTIHNFIHSARRKA